MQVKKYKLTLIYIIYKKLRIEHICLILQWFLIFRTFVSTVMESLKDLEEDCGRAMAKDISTFFELTFGRDQVIIIRISIIIVYILYSKSINFLATRHDARRARNLP